MKPAGCPEKADLSHDGGRCGAKLRGSDPPRRCQRFKSAGRNRCRLHGGATLTGVAHPAYTHGRYIESLPAHMVAKAQAAYDDPELLSLRSEMGVVASRVAELLRLAGDAVAADERDPVDEKLREDVLRRLARAVGERGVPGVWAEVRGWLEQYRRLQEAEVRRGLALQRGVSMEQMVGVIGVLVNIVADHVRDRDVLASIQRDVRARLLARPEQLGAGVG